MAALPLYSITPFTLLDYPNKAACILWFAGCNMRCLYCYNPDIVTNKGKISYDNALDFLRQRKGLLDGVVLSGGECTLHKKLPDFILELKKNGFLVKIDTNGSSPLLLESLIKDKLVDYVALDFKAMPSSFSTITKSNLFRNFELTLTMLLKNQASFEVRTTVHSDLISEAELHSMAGYLSKMGYNGTYYIQNFVNGASTLSPLGISRQYKDITDLQLPDIKVVIRS